MCAFGKVAPEYEGAILRDDAWYVLAGNSPSPLFFVSDRNTGLEVF
jgi:hypothetical protein